MSDAVDVFHVKGPDGVIRSLDEHYDCQNHVEQNPYGAWLAIQNQAYRIKELEAELADAENRANAFATKEMHTAKERGRLQWALQELDTDPAITVAEHVEEDNRLAPFLPRSAAAVAEARAARAALRGD